MSTVQNYGRAALYALFSYAVWTFSDVALKLVKSTNVPQGEIFVISGLTGMLIIFLAAAVRGRVSALQPKHFGWLTAIGLAQWFAFVGWLAALPHLPLTTCYVVVFMTPMTVAVLARVILKEQLGWRRAAAIAAGFAGVIVAVDPLRLLQNSGAWTAYLAVAGSMAGTAAQMLILRAVSQKIPSESTAFYPRLVMVVIGLVSCAATGFVALPPMIFLGIAASGMLGAIGWIMIAKAYKYAPAAAVAPFHYSQMLTGALLGYLIWHDVPDMWLVAGSAIIIAAGIYLVRHERRMDRTRVRA